MAEEPRLEETAVARGSGVGIWPAWLVLLISLLATLAVWQWTAQKIEEQMSADFYARTAEIHHSLDLRLLGYAQIVRGAAGLFNASNKVTREDWRQYVASLQLAETYPAIQAIAFASHVTANEIDGLVREVRASGVADFAVRPEGRRERYVVNAYTEPYEGLNRKALGYDMWQDDIRRKAMEQALQTGRPSITQKITLKVDEAASPVPAFIMYMPVHDRTRKKLRGFVLSPFRMPALAGDLSTPSARGVALTIHDGIDLTESAVLYRSSPEQAGHVPKFTSRGTIDFAGRLWTLSFASEPELESAAAANRLYQVLLYGLVISLLLFAVTWSVASTRRRAVLLAERKEAERRLRDFSTELEKRVRERTKELERANRELESFSYSVSHDLRGPLRAINGFSTILKNEERERLSDDGKELLDRVARAATRLGELIDNVLDYSRAGRLPLADATVDLNDLARRIAGELGEIYRSTEIRVAGLPTVYGDPTMLRQILENLLDNACKYSAGSEKPLVEIGAEAGQGETVLYVRDNGAGFDMRYADKLFGMFQRMHQDNVFPGTGIGLAIVKRLIERHGGRIWAEAEPGRGATFYFTLGKGPAEANRPESQ